MFGYETKKNHGAVVGGRETAQSRGVPLSLLRPHLLSASGLTLSNGVRSSPSLMPFESPALRFLALRKLISIAYDNNRIGSADGNAVVSRISGTVRSRNRWTGGLFLDDLSGNEDSIERGKDDDKMVDDSADSQSEGEEEIMSGSMIMAIGFYKEWISPLLPPACRFVPTCSQYGVQAIKEFGPSKGLILTAWRLARCSPLGGKGYDPPVWPPVPYTYGSY